MKMIDVNAVFIREAKQARSDTPPGIYFQLRLHFALCIVGRPTTLCIHKENAGQQEIFSHVITKCQ